MKIKKLTSVFLLLSVAIAACSVNNPEYKGLDAALLTAQKDTVITDSIVYHRVRVDQDGKILPWYSANPAESYNAVLGMVWNFWKNMAADSNGQKYYMNHQVWRPNHDKRGLGGDQVMMALSSWNLYYNYTGDEALTDNMKYMADYYLAHSLSSPVSQWPNLPYPYNNAVETGVYDGDMILGKGFLQPDKAGSFGYELVCLYKKTGEDKYLDAAVKIANTLAAKVQPGDNENSPWPFKVNAETGETGILAKNEVWYEGMSKDLKKQGTQKGSSYTTNWTGALNLFDELVKLGKGNAGAYKKAFDITLSWLKAYPAKTNKWGPFFEDVPRWSDTQINAVTYAMYLLEHPALDTNWRASVKNIIDWVHKELGDSQYIKYGIICTDEQTAYRVPGNSHSARQASVELMYWEKTGDTSYAANAVRELNWATYMVDNDGKNFYPTNDVWMTDGYGDYVRHYLRAMAAAPQLAPDGDHMLSTSSIVKKISYTASKISYTLFDGRAEEKFRLKQKPASIHVNEAVLKEAGINENEGWTWQPLDRGGILTVRHANGSIVEIEK